MTLRLNIVSCDVIAYWDFQDKLCLEDACEAWELAETTDKWIDTVVHPGNRQPRTLETSAFSKLWEFCSLSEQAQQMQRDLECCCYHYIITTKTFLTDKWHHVPTLVCQGCHVQSLKIRLLNSRNCITILEASSQRSWCWQGLTLLLWKCQGTVSHPLS